MPDSESVPFDLCRTVEESLQAVADAAASRGIDLAMRYPAAVPRDFRGRPEALRRSLTRLLAEAVRYTNRGYVLVEASAGAEPGRVRIAIEDTGSCISGSPALEIPGGTVEYETRPEGGSVFRIALQLESLPEAGRRLPENLTHPRRRVLLAGRKRLGRNVLRDTLADLNMDTVCIEAVEDVPLALREAAARGAVFDLAVVDLSGAGAHVSSLADSLSAGPPLLLAAPAPPGPAFAAMFRAGRAGFVETPVRRSELEDALAALLAGTPARVGATRWAWNVLLVDDNGVDQRVAAAQLQALRCRVDIAAGGREAVEKVRADCYDLVFMDCTMPDVDGFEAARRIRAMEGAARHTAIVGMMARESPDERRRCRNAGMDDCVAKPLVESDLRLLIGRRTTAPGT